MRYHLIDIGRLAEADLALQDGLPPLWFRLENATNPGRSYGLRF
jgi:hypothetical protein